MFIFHEKESDWPFAVRPSGGSYRNVCQQKLTEELEVRKGTAHIRMHMWKFEVCEADLVFFFYLF